MSGAQSTSDLRPATTESGSSMSAESWAFTGSNERAVESVGYEKRFDFANPGVFRMIELKDANCV